MKLLLVNKRQEAVGASATSGVGSGPRRVERVSILRAHSRFIGFSRLLVDCQMRYITLLVIESEKD